MDYDYELYLIIVIWLYLFSYYCDVYISSVNEIYIYIKKELVY